MLTKYIIFYVGQDILIQSTFMLWVYCSTNSSLEDLPSTHQKRKISSMRFFILNPSSQKWSMSQRRLRPWSKDFWPRIQVIELALWRESRKSWVILGLGKKVNLLLCQKSHSIRPNRLSKRSLMKPKRFLLQSKVTKNSRRSFLVKTSSIEHCTIWWMQRFGSTPKNKNIQRLWW